MNAPGSNGITLVVGRYCYCNLVVVVVVVSPLGRSGPVKLLPCQLLVYRIRWKNEGREGDGIVHFAGIVGTRLTLRAAHTWCCLGPIVCSRLCALCVDASRGGMGIPWVSFTLLVSPLRHLVQHPHKLVNAVK